jgi:hypothetical protein
MSAPIVTRRQAVVAAAAASLPGVPALVTSAHAAPADRLLIAAETEITCLYAGMTGTRSDEEAYEIVDQASRFDDFIVAAVPTSLSDCAVKVRRVLDAEIGMVAGQNERDVPSLALVLEYIETLTGGPTHPTRRVVRSSDDSDTLAR